MHRFPQHRLWNIFLALCLCAGALSHARISRADGDGTDDYLRGPSDPPNPIGAGDPDIPINSSAMKPGAGSGRSGVGIYRNTVPIEGVVTDQRVWMIRFHAAARLWMAYIVRR